MTTTTTPSGAPPPPDPDGASRPAPTVTAEPSAWAAGPGSGAPAASDAPPPASPPADRDGGDERRPLPLLVRGWLSLVHSFLAGIAATVLAGISVWIISAALGATFTIVFAVPLFWLLQRYVRWQLRAERAMRSALLGDPGLPVPGPTPKGFKGMVADLTSLQFWRLVGWSTFRLITAPLVMVLTLAAWIVPVVLIESGLLYRVPPSGRVGLWFVRIDDPVSATITVIVGVLFLLVVSVRVADWLTRGELATSQAVLGEGPTVVLRAELAEERERRVLSLRAAEEERRRIERDLHDGAQARLANLALTLGMAREKIRPDDPARPLIEEAHDESKRALVELRDLARGIHPAVLEDRGLDAALSALAARCPAPVRIDVRVPVRPRPDTEKAAYFVVAEALTNVARHSGATHADVHVWTTFEKLRVRVADDGRGGVNLDAGTGLRGLRNRIEGLGGRFVIQSPDGGPTVLDAEVPLQ
jgi:signal transduction histidine kinase